MAAPSGAIDVFVKANFSATADFLAGLAGLVIAAHPGVRAKDVRRLCLQHIDAHLKEQSEALDAHPLNVRSFVEDVSFTSWLDFRLHFCGYRVSASSDLRRLSSVWRSGCSLSPLCSGLGVAVAVLCLSKAKPQTRLQLIHNARCVLVFRSKSRLSLHCRSVAQASLFTDHAYTSYVLDRTGKSGHV